MTRKCDSCGGDGKYRYNKEKPCLTCGGSGRVAVVPPRSTHGKRCRCCGKVK